MARFLAFNAVFFLLPFAGYAAWLVATCRGISVLPLSAPAVSPRVSARVREILADHDRPYLAVRLLRHAGEGPRRAGRSPPGGPKAGR